MLAESWREEKIAGKYPRSQRGRSHMSLSVEVGVYYFPNYHADPRNEGRYGKGWTEWDLVRAAAPRWPGHRQPVVPAWGYFDEADPVWMERQIDLAADHGITTFIFDWYWYNDGPFLDRALDEGFLKSANRSRLKFALMWANHNWSEMFPAGPNPIWEAELQYPGAVTAQTWDGMTRVLVERYFTQPNYLRIDGKPYFSFFELPRFVESMGGLSEASEGLALLRDRAIAAGLPGVHLNAMTSNVGGTVGSHSGGDVTNTITQLALDSVTDYCWVHQHDPDSDGFPVGSYENAMISNVAAWDGIPGRFALPFYPNVSMGWDCSPRCSPAFPYEKRGYPWTAIYGGNTPELFRQALQQQRAWAESHHAAMVTLNAWNEWTEGSYLLPDTVCGNQYLEAVRSVYASKKQHP